MTFARPSGDRTPRLLRGVWLLGRKLLIGTHPLRGTLLSTAAALLLVTAPAYAQDVTANADEGSAVRPGEPPPGTIVSSANIDQWQIGRAHV